MLQGFIKSNSFGWVIFQHSANKVKQALMICVLAMHEFLQGLTASPDVPACRAVLIPVQLVMVKIMFSAGQGK